MSKAVFFSIPAIGHINAVQGLLTELVKRGDQITFVNSAETESSVQHTGVRFRAYPDSARLRNWMQEGNSNSSFARSALNLLLVAEEFMPFSLALLRDESPDFVSTDSITPWGKFAAKALHLSLVASISTFPIKLFRTAPRPPLRVVAPMLADWLRVTPNYLQIARRLKRRYGVEADGLMNVLMTTGDLNLVYTSREFQPAAEAFDESYKFVGATTTERPSGVDFPFDRLTRRPLIYISLGTVNTMNLAFYDQCVAAFADFPAQFILSTGARADLQQMGEIPADFIVRETVPQLDILKRVDAFSTHGGINSVQDGLLFGVPLVVAPQ